MGLPWSTYKVKFKSTQTIYSQQVSCHVDENEFNMTTNPSAISSSYSGSTNFFSASVAVGSNTYYDSSSIKYTYVTDGQLNANITGSDFAPYVTTIGLYNETSELIAVAKLAQPFRMPSNTDVNFIIRYDF